MVGWETGYRDEEAVCPRGRAAVRPTWVYGLLPGHLARVEMHALEELLEALVGSDPVEDRHHGDVQESGIALGASLLQQRKGLGLLAERDQDARRHGGSDVRSTRLFAQLMQRTQRVRGPTLHAVDLSQVEMRLIEPRVDLERLAIPLERGVVVAIEEADARGHVMHDERSRIRL